jgi:hypothetical protein
MSTMYPRYPSARSARQPVQVPMSVPVPRDEDRVVALLRAGVPLSLLLDLAGGDPHSEELYERERAS